MLIAKRDSIKGQKNMQQKLCPKMREEKDILIYRLR